MFLETPIERRQRAGSIIARLLLLIFRASHDTYNRGVDLNKVMPEIFVAMAIRVIQVRTGKAATLNQIVRLTTFKRTSVKRYCDALIREGMVREEDGRLRYGINPDYRGAQVAARHFRLIRRAIIAASTVLQALK